MRLFVLALLLGVVPVLGDTVWTLSGSGTDWDGTHPVMVLTVPAEMGGEATSVTSWSTHGDDPGYVDFGDITDHLGVFWPYAPGIVVHAPDTLYASDAASYDSIPFHMTGMSSPDATHVEGIYSFFDLGQTPTGPLGPFTVTNPAAVPEPASAWLLLAGIPLLLLGSRRKARGWLLH